MLQIIQNFKTGELKIENIPEPALKAGGILVKNEYSLISAGTERIAVETAQKSLLGKAQSRPDLVEKVKRAIQRDGLMSTIQLIRNKLDKPLPLGYSSAGMIIAVAADVDEFSVGDRVACAGQGYASHAEKIFVPRNLAVKVPDNVEMDEAAFATLGAIAMQGVRQCEITVGEKVAVIGLGLLGLLTVQILKASGCQVVGMDIDPQACDMAKKMGANKVTTNSGEMFALTEELTYGYGVDKVIITASTKGNEPLLLAGDIVRKKGQVVIVGLVPVNVPRSPFYEKEVAVKFSCSYGPGRYDPYYEEKGIDYPFPYVRWTQNRNILSFLELVSEKKIDIKSIITHRFNIEDADAAYNLITGKTKTAEKFIGIVLQYGHRESKEADNILYLKPKTKLTTDTVNVGFIGAGNFAQGFLMPSLKKESAVNLVGVSDARGITANSVGKKFNFEFITTNNNEIVEHTDINAVFIATRHNLHAGIVIDCLKHNKSIYVEKPLAITQQQLDEIIAAYQEHPGNLMVGFNRRYSPHIDKVRSFISHRQPIVITYRINAGFIPSDHWTQDPEEGGGRIIGEVCHFIDICNYSVDSAPKSIFAESLNTVDQANAKKDAVCIIIKYANGSVGNIIYSSVGDKAFPKERIEIFKKDTVVVIDDFIQTTIINGGKKIKFKTSGQNKGHSLSVHNFIQSVKQGNDSPIPFNDSVKATILTFKILESLSTGQPVFLL